MLYCYSNIDLVRLAANHLLPFLQPVAPMCKASCMLTIFKIHQILLQDYLEETSIVLLNSIACNLEISNRNICIERCSVLSIYYLNCRHIYNAKLYQHQMFIKMLYLLDNDMCVSVDKRINLRQRTSNFFFSVKAF